jgi:hypothetical protein
MSVTFTLFTASQDVLALNMLGGVDSFVAPFERVYGNIVPTSASTTSGWL